MRQFILCTVIAPTLAGFVWFSIFDGTALHLEIFQGVPLIEAVKANVASGLHAMLGRFRWAA